jgi:hypothetical protein
MSLKVLLVLGFAAAVSAKAQFGILKDLVRLPNTSTCRHFVGYSKTIKIASFPKKKTLRK